MVILIPRGRISAAKIALFAVVLLLVFAGCAGLPPETAVPEAVSTPAPESPAAGEDSDYSPKLPPGLPVEAGEYLQALARAFSTADRDFLLAQGESQFEAENRGRYDEESYLALLYRVGPLSGDRASVPVGVETPRLNPAQIRRIEFAGWEEQGPALIISARLITKTGEAIPCQLTLLWRLREPKILGVYP
ncbi:MAG: hypothetical protein LBP20_05465 [Treponema sp.]|nr:hypothetical protein [Treponema sp.]